MPYQTFMKIFHRSPALDPTYLHISKIAYTRNPVAKTANYTCLVEESGTHFTTTGATGAVTFTLPAETNLGVEYVFSNTVDQNMTVTAASGKMVALNNAAATSVAFSTTSQKIGGSVKVVCDGTKWIAQPYGAGTVTVA